MLQTKALTLLLTGKCAKTDDRDMQSKLFTIQYKIFKLITLYFIEIFRVEHFLLFSLSTL